MHMPCMYVCIILVICCIALFSPFKCFSQLVSYLPLLGLFPEWDLSVITARYLRVWEKLANPGLGNMMFRWTLVRPDDP